MYSVSVDSERYGKEWKRMSSFGLREVVRMHPDDVIALKAWVMAKRLYEHELATICRDGYLHGRMPG
ncbi:MAG: hypothetical protein ABSE13_01570 [Methanoregula sp.]|jgi:hypothetical protein